ncbi:hypothetical protein BDV24DRAFT_166692 [Aspergillus arachidicola]|uniref:Uncharacterized protein n=1 Tax=Aspergillus arachidicola TaxID=656916 RepID=A0A5N6Y2J2_9EURO|nr:hypothetical protein BDV24DRAFT_166692 [Aspergillus arachidicola]
MSMIQRTIRAIRGRFSRIDRSKNLDSQRTEMYSMLADLYKELEGLKAEALESEHLEVLPVHILPLDLKRTTELAIPRSLDPGAYFVPLSEEFIQQRPMDTTDPETQRGLNNVATILRPGYSSSTVQYRPLSSYRKAGVLVDRLVMEMSSRQLNCEAAMPNMTLITKWRGNTDFHLNPAFDRHDWDHRDGYHWIIDFFYACSSHPTFPYIKVIMHHSEAKDPELVLKAEVMAIVATMWSRLCTETLLDHLIVPVMLFTFARCHVRILIGIHDGQDLRIAMSEFIEYSEGSQDLWDLLTRYLGYDFNHQLTTEKLPSAYLEEDLS